MDEIETRLKETADRCIKAYEGWSGAKKDAPLREEMLEAVHELRKVASRLEIVLAASEREDLAQRPIPIPPHRSSRPRSGGGELPGFITEGGEEASEGGSRAGGGFQQRRRPMRPRPPMPEGNGPVGGEGAGD